MITTEELKFIRSKLPPRAACIGWQFQTIWKLLTEVEALQAQIQGRLNRTPVRTGDPDTSIEAAKKVKLAMNESRRNVLRMFEKVPSMTDEDLVSYYAVTELPKQSASSLRSRRAELALMGLVFDSGTRRKNKSGNNCIVWTTVRKELTK